MRGVAGLIADQHEDAVMGESADPGLVPDIPVWAGDPHSGVLPRLSGVRAAHQTDVQLAARTVGAMAGNDHGPVGQLERRGLEGAVAAREAGLEAARDAPGLSVVVRVDDPARRAPG